MSEPYDPQPAPEPNGYHDPHPPRCPFCQSIIDIGRESEGWCPEHGMVLANYAFSDPKSEIEERRTQ